MKSNIKFTNQPSEFWSYVKLIPTKLGYSRNDNLLTYTVKDCHQLFNSLNINYDLSMLTLAIEYLNYRSEILTSYVKNRLMNAKSAEDSLNKLILQIPDIDNYRCALPMNKQKGDKRKLAFFTCIINIITEQTLRNFYIQTNTEVAFDSNPQNLVYFSHEHYNTLCATLSRRYDGVIPALHNPFAVWEIKEYYYTTTFGSRIADGVYETQLDGYELTDVPECIRPKHYFFVDDYNTWWNMGKSYLCRIIDMLHQQKVDEVFFGSEVLDQWADTLSLLLYQKYNINY